MVIWFYFALFSEKISIDKLADEHPRKLVNQIVRLELSDLQIMSDNKLDKVEPFYALEFPNSMEKIIERNSSTI